MDYLKLNLKLYFLYIYNLQTTNYKLQTTNYKLCPINKCEFPSWISYTCVISPVYSNS